MMVKLRTYLVPIVCEEWNQSVDVFHLSQGIVEQAYGKNENVTGVDSGGTMWWHVTGETAVVQCDDMSLGFTEVVQCGDMSLGRQ